MALLPYLGINLSLCLNMGIFQVKTYSGRVSTVLVMTAQCHRPKGSAVRDSLCINAVGSA